MTGGPSYWAQQAGGPANGTCKNCPREAASLDADFCSQACRAEYEDQQARAEALKARAEQAQQE